MKYLLSIVFVTLFVAGVWADPQTITLDTPEDSTPVEYPKIKLGVIRIDVSAKTLFVPYQRLDADGNPILSGSRNPWQEFVCQDIPWPITDAECVGADDPLPCCEAATVGSCDETLASSCFSDVFATTVSCPGDAGKKLGFGLRKLIWNQMKAVILPTPANDGVFDDGE
jgi:hypothetical protein